MDLKSRLRAIVQGGAPRPPADGRRELTYEPDDGYRNAAAFEPADVAAALGGRVLQTPFGACIAVDRRYESDRWHGGIQIGDCSLDDLTSLRILDPDLPPVAGGDDGALRKTVFVDLETTGLSGGAGMLAFLVGCGYFDLGAFQVRQFLLTSHAAERALLAAVAEFFADADLFVTYNGKTFDIPVMETRWLFHRMEMPGIGGASGVPHFDMLHPARRLWKQRDAEPAEPAGVRPWSDPRTDACCRLATLERRLFDVRRHGDVPGLEIPSRFFRFVRSGDPRPLEPVLEHNRIDLVSLAAVTARALQLARHGRELCRDHAEALALGKVLERAEHFARAEGCFRYAAESAEAVWRGEALYRLGIRLRRERRYLEAAEVWRTLVELTERASRRHGTLGTFRQIAVEALAVHQEHRAKDLMDARRLALTSLEESAGARADGARHRIARLDRKLARGLFSQRSIFDEFDAADAIRPS